jgi:CubicO group peptidase (beta-lactamase class C family)
MQLEPRLIHYSSMPQNKPIFFQLCFCRLLFCVLMAAIAGAIGVTSVAGFRIEKPPASLFSNLPASSAPLPVPFEVAVEAGTHLPRLQSLLVSRGGDLVLERYFNGTRRDRPANIKSASKSVISALVGIAIDRGLISGVKEPISHFFPYLSADPTKSKITIEDLLTMRSGLETTSNRNYGAWVHSRDWVRHALGRPLVSAPGTTMEYSTGNSHVLSAILTKATRMTTWQFAQENISKPLGFSLAPWPRDPQGIYFGGNDMLMTPRQMLAFGELFLNRGRVGDRQVVPAKWIDASFAPRVQSPRDDDRSYGYGWWIQELAGHRARYAWGFGGQYIIVVPDLELVVVSTSSSTVSEDRRSHRFAVLDIIEHFIVKPIANERSESSSLRDASLWNPASALGQSLVSSLIDKPSSLQ